MNSSFIDKCLHKKFRSHKYQLSNSFVYNEESDFFSITSTGYAQEIEVKVSRSDFQADFKKIKHSYFQQIYNGQNYVVRKGPVLYSITEPIMENFKGEDGKGVWEEDKYGRKRPLRVPSGKYSTYQSLGNTDGYVKRGCTVKAISTGVSIFRPKLPNKFWFVVPEDLVSKKEIPEYAGLYYVRESGDIVTVKKAPFIHKEKHDLNKVLLDKFYYLSLRLQNSIKWTEKK